MVRTWIDSMFFLLKNKKINRVYNLRPSTVNVRLERT